MCNKGAVSCVLTDAPIKFKLQVTQAPCVWNQNDLPSGDDEGDLAFIAFLMSF